MELLSSSTAAIFICSTTQRSTVCVDNWTPWRLQPASLTGQLTHSASQGIVAKCSSVASSLRSCVVTTGKKMFCLAVSPAGVTTTRMAHTGSSNSTKIFKFFCNQSFLLFYNKRKDNTPDSHHHKATRKQTRQTENRYKKLNKRENLTLLMQTG